MTPPQQFNSAGRHDALTRIGEDRLDLLIIGGGITGCGIARDAALRGWTVGLVEKEDFAFGTSSRSSKIVHGGVRYLEYGHFLLVKEAAQERAVLRRIAPHLVHPLPFVFPVFSGESLLKIRAGLTVFDFLAASEGLERLCWLYGNQLDHLLELAAADPSWLEPLHPDVPALRGEVRLAVEREMALTPVDFMDRRAALLLFSPNFGLAGAEAAADIMSEALGWDTDRRARELAEYRELAAEHNLPST